MGLAPKARGLPVIPSRQRKADIDLFSSRGS